MSDEFAERRPYRLGRRGDRMAETRQRIIEATVELHRTVGPAATEISEIARRAGVQRVTVYSHFPDEAALLGACSSHWRDRHPAPDPQHWQGRPPAEMLRLALVELYRWYRETEPMTANVLRDMARLPALRAIIEDGRGRYMDAVRAQLLAAVAPPPGRAAHTGAALDTALAFPTWRTLSRLGDTEAAALAAGFVELAATG